MKINKISPAIKQINIPLKNGKDALIKLSDNSLECMITKDKYVVEACGHQTPKGISPDEIILLHEKLKDNIKEGIDFFNEFTKAIFS